MLFASLFLCVAFLAFFGCRFVNFVSRSFLVQSPKIEIEERLNFVCIAFVDDFYAFNDCVKFNYIS